ncbi:esterase / lipase [Galdieria sulphuraria]|uniref:Protein phosphatase methylesterase 1 n=1 Tax=Galdieria sulphuraria TaxID=130081 RepID=M2WXK1_GALSU|nr:esterase / lipase [Galdieria sulphuraria]EME28780.1 esterase / lipase [Galdieria sulphuraria]|eukprot:XP_005705300.1 esterase / lipase [Galdieria sulphuraria]
MSRPPPLKPIRSVGESESNFSKHSLLQPIIEEKNSRNNSFASGTHFLAEDNQRLSELSPLPWNDYFRTRTLVLPENCKGIGFRVYATGSLTELLLAQSTVSSQTDETSSLYTSHRAASSFKQPLLMLFHGGGYSALSFGLLVKYLVQKLPNPESLSVLAFDARGHGETDVENEQNLSAEQQVQDALDLLKSIFGKLDSDLPPIVLAGHSMGGAIAVRVGASGQIPTLCGLIVIDVVEGTAMASLPHMQTVLMKRPKSFSSVEKAILYSLETGQTKSRESCRLSLPSQLRWNEDEKCYSWRTNLEESECYWKSWFENLSPTFLKIAVPKLLILAGQDRLDKPLTIAQMQGQFQLSVVRDSGHNLHEDQPEGTAQIFVEFLRRHSIIN